MSNPFKLSVIVVSYNMAREIPRTIASLSPTYQQAIAADEYEVVLVDNGSDVPPQVHDLKQYMENISVLRANNPTPSPCQAINKALTQSKGDVICVLVDGARMASPGLLKTALDASASHERAIVGTIGFHLGHDLQSKAMTNGYDQRVEDALLQSVPWQDDGYRLFDISVPAASSAKGWFDMPAESNALTMHRDLWYELGGYDTAFKAPGGGLANHDIWYRACSLPSNMVTLLLGEATFHQFHGGTSTNAQQSKLSAFREEYLKIRSTPYRRPNVPIRYFGILHDGVPLHPEEKLRTNARTIEHSG